MTPRVSLDSVDFNRAAQRLVATSKKSAEQVLREQAALFVVDAAKLTPPNKDFKWNKKGGEQAIRADLARVFVPSTRKDATTDLAAIHRAARGRFGRVNRSTSPVPARGVAAYRRQVLALVGKMAAGWKSAAATLGAKLPAWITRHSAAGFAKVETRGSEVNILVANQSVYPRLANEIERRLPYALRRRRNAINRRVDNFLRRNALAAGFR
jgi:hypothetical protein